MRWVRHNTIQSVSTVFTSATHHSQHTPHCLIFARIVIGIRLGRFCWFFLCCCCCFLSFYPHLLLSYREKKYLTIGIKICHCCYQRGGLLGEAVYLWGRPILALLWPEGCSCCRFLFFLTPLLPFHLYILFSCRENKWLMKGTNMWYCYI